LTLPPNLVSPANLLREQLRLS